VKPPRIMIVSRGDTPVAARPDVVVQLRDKDASAEQLAARARTLAGRCVLSINRGGAEIDARAVGADFIHLPESAPLPPANTLPFGRSVHSVEAARTAAEAAAYLVAGPIWPSTDKPSGLGLATFARICTVAGVTPVFGIGGITSIERAAEVLTVGAHGVAGIRAFSGAFVDELVRLIAG